MPRIRPPHRFRKPLLLGAAGLLVAGGLVAGLQSAYADTETNLALGKTATGSASCNDKETPAQAVNGSTDKGLSDKWCSGVPHATLKIDLGAETTLNKLVVKHAGAGGEPKSWNTRDFTLEVSTDGDSFKTVSEVRNNRADVTVHPITPVAARYILLTVNVPTSSRFLRAARIYEVEAYAADKPAPPAPSDPPAEPTTPPTTNPTTPPPTTKPADPPAEPACSSKAPEKLTDYVAEHTSAMTRTGCNADVALYMDENMLTKQTDEQKKWVLPFATDVWKYFKATYGGCAAQRKTSAAEGGCEKFGAPNPALMFAHKDTYSGGTVVGRFDSRGDFRTTVDVGYWEWNESDNQLRDIIVHEFCHQVEGDSQGTNGSPAFGIWGDSKWAEYCLVDFYANTNRKADADRLIKEFSGKTDKNLPEGAGDVAWFKDWFGPLWHDGGDKATVMNKYFELLAQNFPTQDANNGANKQYSRGLNLGEYVLFTSAAAGKDLSGRAAAAFNTAWKPEQFEQAKKDFPNLKF